MTSLGIILMGTGLIIFFSARTMIRGTKKMLEPRDPLEYEEQAAEGKVPKEGHHQISSAETEFTEMVKKAMRILYVVGGTCFIIGLILAAFGSL